MLIISYFIVILLKDVSYVDNIVNIGNDEKGIGLSQIYCIDYSFLINKTFCCLKNICFKLNVSFFL